MSYISCSITFVSFPNCNKCKLDYLNISFPNLVFSYYVNALPTNVHKFNFSDFEHSF